MQIIKRNVFDKNKLKIEMLEIKIDNKLSSIIVIIIVIE